MPEYTVRRVNTEDFDYEGIHEELCIIAENYVAESGLSIIFDRFKSSANIRNLVESSDCIFLALFSGVRVVGVSVLMFEALWSKEEFCMMYIFYIDPSFRNHLAANRLIKSTLRFAKSRNATHIFANTMVRMGERATISYEAMLKLNGFSPLSPVYVKDI